MLLRDVEAALSGSGRKKPTPGELDTLKIVRRYIVAAIDIAEGDVITEKNITVLRSEGTLTPDMLPLVSGRKAVRSIAAFTPIDLDMLR